MDNPWADPWDDSTKKPTLHDDQPTPPKWDPLPTLQVKQELEESDEPPSWDPKETVEWAPVVKEVPAVPSWNADEDSWSSADISLPTPTTTVLPIATLDDVSVPNLKISEGDDNLDEPTQSLPPAVPIDTHYSPDAESQPSPLPVSNSPPVPIQDVDTDDFGGDGFGGFESGLDSTHEDGSAAWLPPSSDAFNVGADPSDGDGWGSSWGAVDTSPHHAEEEPDEWETARQQKAEQDKLVPPEYLNGILTQFEQLGEELWKDKLEAGDGGLAHRRFDPQALNRNSASERIVPEELTLPISRPFPQTFVSKRLVDGIKLTRHTLLTSKGPLAMYMASKGSTTWEASVKAKPDLSQDDAAPAGWKIVPRSESPVPDPSQKRASSGGIMSFFTRRANTSTSGTPQRSASPAPSTTSSIKPEANSPRLSVDTPSITQPKGKTSAAPSPTSSLFHSPVATMQSTDIPAAQSTPQETSKAQDFFAPKDEEDHDPPPPSTISRFLGRFSRGSGSTPLSQRGDSVSLSADDLQFLSDVVPVAHEAVTDESAQLKALTSMIQSTPLPMHLPPPLAPPPPGAQTLASRFTPAVSAASQKASNMSDDLFSIFDSPAVSGNPATDSSDKQRQPLPSIPLSTSTTSSSSSFPDFFGSALSPALPPPPIPPKIDIKTNISAASNSFGAMASSTMSSIASRTTMSSSSNQPTLVPTLLPPPPPANRTRAPIGSLNSRSQPSSRSQTPSLLAPPSQPTIDEDDEFADFIASPVGATTTRNAAPVSVPSSNTVQFDDFGDFFASPIPPTRNPIPPSTSQGHMTHNSLSVSQSSRSSSGSIASKSSDSSPRVSRAEHQRTLSLLETVANRGGSWLAPPSPLPEALPPPNPPSKKATNVDLFSGGGGSSFQSQQERAIASLAPPPALAPPPPAPKQPLGGASGWSFPAPPSGSNGSAAPRALSPPVPGSGAASRSTPPNNGLAASNSLSGTGWSFPAPPRSSSAASSSSTASRTVSPPPPAGASNGFGAFSMGASSPPPQSKSPPVAQMLKPAPAASSSALGGKGGLSAQDLAFFEGL